MPATCNQLVAEVVWRERTEADRAEPLAYVLTSDDPMRANVVTSVTSAVGPHCGTAYPASGNNGDMLPYLSGTWDTGPSTPHPVPTGLELYVARTGGIYANAEWLWRYTDDAAGQYRGWHDPRYANLVHTPFAVKDTATQHHVVCYSRAFNRVICGRVRGSRFEFAIRSANTSDPTVNYSMVNYPTTGSFPPNKRPSSIVQNCPFSALVEMSDGSLRLFYAYVPDTVFNPTLLDVDMLGSSDGGTTWYTLKERIITEVFGEPQLFASLRAAVSGDWTRLEIFFVFPATGYTNDGVYSLASGDGGATWLVAQEPDGTDNTAANTDTVGRYEVHDIEGLGTLDGRFIRVRCRPISFAGDFAVLETCTRDGAWDGVLNGQFSAANLKAVWLSRGGAYLLLLPHYDDGAGVVGFGGDAGRLIPTNTWNDVTTYIDIGNTAAGSINKDVQGLGGIQLAMPKYGDLAWVGDRWAFLHGQLLRALGTTSTYLRAPTLTYLGGYSRRPVTRDEAPLTNPRYAFTTRYWSPELALVPAGGTATETAAGTPWQSFISAGTTYSTTDYTLQMTVGTTVGATGYFREQLSSTGNTLFADHGVLGFRTRALPGTVPPAGLPGSAGQYYAPRWGCYVTSQSAVVAGNTFGVGVHLTGDGRIGVYDAAANTTLYVSATGALAGITTGTWYDVRLAMAYGTFISPRDSISPVAWYCEVAWSAAGDNTWSSTGLLTLTNGTPFGFGSEIYDIGHKINVTSTTGVYEWREFWFSRDSHYANTGMRNPDDVRGVLASTYEQHVAQGVHARWGGDAGFTKDTFTSPARWQYGAEQLMTASPASHWRSATTAAQTITLDAQLASTGPERRRFEHSGIAVLGTNSRYTEVEYASDAAFTYPTRFLLDGLRYSCQVSSTTAIGTEAMHVDLTGNDVELVADGELAGHYLRRTGGAFKALRIAYNAGNRVFFDTVGTTLALSSYGISSGASVHLWASNYTATFDDYPTGVKVAGLVAGITTYFADMELPRYMRIAVRGDNTQGAPAEGYWRIGTVVAGLTLPITVPLNWQQTDGEAGNVQLETAQSGVRSAYVAGAPRRTIKGTSEGDVDRWRVAFRGMARTLAAYSANPVVLVQDDQQQNLSMVYSRFTGSTELENAGWRYDTARARWEQVGDLAVTFEEEV
jgi:hypothetical protein